MFKTPNPPDIERLSKYLKEEAKNHIYVMLGNYEAASKQLVEKVISTMSNDEIGNAAKSEDLVTELGNLWL